MLSGYCGSLDDECPLPTLRCAWKDVHLFFSSHRPLEEPKVISAFSGKQGGKHVVHIACGSTYSAAITAEGELYTWGRGNYGRLGHGMSAAWSRRCPQALHPGGLE